MPNPPNTSEIEKLKQLGILPGDFAMPNQETFKQLLPSLAPPQPMPGITMTPQQKAAMLAQQAAKSAREGKSLFSSPGVNQAVGFKGAQAPAQGGATPSTPAPDQPIVPVPMPQQKQKEKPKEPTEYEKAFMSLLGRTADVRAVGMAIPDTSSGTIIPAHVLRSDVVKFLESDAGVVPSYVDIRDIPDMEKSVLERWIDPEKYKRWKETKK